MPEKRRGFEDLVLEAFGMAAQQGRPEWYRMAGTVLKNRLLDLTDRSFDEADYGADRFGALVEQFDEMLEVDHSARPLVVELREPFRSQVPPPHTTITPSSSIRADLWHAIVDYSQGQQWKWDRAKAKAIPVREAADTDVGDDLPTLDQATLGAWRAEFVEEHSAGLSDEEAAAVQAWATEARRTVALPKRLRGPWNARMIAGVHERLLVFFQTHELEPPRDLLVRRQPRKPADELRSFILRCVALMNDRELKELKIPAEVAMRARR